MNNKIYVGNLSWSTTEDDLRNDLAEYGEVTEVRIIMDRETNRSKGFGFVTFASAEAAQNAVDQTNGAEYQGRQLKVSIAEDRPRSNRSGGGTGGGRDFRNERTERRGGNTYF
jgi:cold-inducible RNA-binding protein